LCCSCHHARARVPNFNLFAEIFINSKKFEHEGIFRPFQRRRIEARDVDIVFKRVDAPVIKICTVAVQNISIDIYPDDREEEIFQRILYFQIENKRGNSLTNYQCKQGSKMSKNVED
jgi:hypothetical protein